jgi:hypothetical protein
MSKKWYAVVGGVIRVEYTGSERNSRAEFDSWKSAITEMLTDPKADRRMKEDYAGKDIKFAGVDEKFPRSRHVMHVESDIGRN